MSLLWIQIEAARPQWEGKGRWECSREMDENGHPGSPCAFEPKHFTNFDDYADHATSAHKYGKPESYPYTREGMEAMNHAWSSLEREGHHKAFSPELQEHGPTHRDGVTAWPSTRLETGHHLSLYSHHDTVDDTHNFHASLLHPEDDEGEHPLLYHHLGDNPHRVGEEFTKMIRHPDFQNAIKNPDQVLEEKKQEHQTMMKGYHDEFGY